MHSLYDAIVHLSEQFGYWGIFIMMTVESSFIPFPSELAMIPAGINIALGNMSWIWAFLAGTLGALFWASINYFWWKYLGKPVTQSLVKNYGKYVLLNQEHFAKAQNYFDTHGSITTLIGRFIPAVRQLISIPAGMFAMPYGKFILYTTIGAGIWNGVLLFVGYIAGKNEDQVKALLSNSTLVIFIFLATILSIYVWKFRKK